MNSVISLTAFYAPWCYDLESEIKDFVASSVEAVKLKTYSVAQTSLTEEQHETSYNIQNLKSKQPYSSGFGYIGKSLCVCLFPDEAQCGSIERRESIVKELLDNFDEVIFQDNVEIQNLLQIHCIEDVPCLSIKTISGSDNFECTMKLTPTQSNLPFTVESQFAASMEMYNSYNLLRALNGFSLLLERSPQHAGALFNSACILHMIGYPTLAIKFLSSVLLLDQNDSIAHSFLWALATSTDGSCHEACIKCYRELAKNGDVTAIVKLAALTGDGESAAHGDPSYARKIYDDMADSFEKKLVTSLGYDAPWRLFDMLQEALKKPPISGNYPSAGQWRSVDLGCGSGLVGRVFSSLTGLSVPEPNHSSSAKSEEPLLSIDQIRPFVHRSGPYMLGMDVSEKIARLAARDGGYSAVVVGDLLEGLRALNNTNAQEEEEEEARRSVDLVVAADTFIYVGALGAVYKEVHRVLRPGGLFMFTVEELMTPSSPVVTCIEEDSDGDVKGAVPGWGCQRQKGSARFAHSKSYLEQLARFRGFELLDERSFVLRKEGTLPVQGVALLLAKL